MICRQKGADRLRPWKCLPGAYVLAWFILAMVIPHSAVFGKIPDLQQDTAGGSAYEARQEVLGADNPLAGALDPNGLPAPSVDALDSLFADWDSAYTPGCAVSIYEQGRPVVSRAWGMADLEHQVPNTPSTIFEAGSVSKQVLTGVVVILALQETFSLNDDVRTWIPELPDYGRTITIRHMMNHTSGLRDWGSVAALSGWGRSHRTHTHDHVLDILSRQSRLNFPPGERYSYSNTGYNLMVILVERATGQSLADLSQELVFGPLSMTSSQWRDEYTRIVPGRSSAYSGQPGALQYRINRPIEHVYGNGGLLTTVGDLQLWNHALHTGFFGEAFTREMTRQGVLVSGRTIDYASGVMHGSDHGFEQWWHTGATSGYRAYLAWFSEPQLSVALLCNVTGAHPGNLGSALSALYLPHHAGLHTGGSLQEFMPQSPSTRKFTGIWKHPRNYEPLEIVEQDGRLRVRGGAWLVPAGENEFRAGTGSTHYRFLWPESRPEMALNASDSERPFIRVVRQGFTEELLIPVNASAQEPAPLDLAGIWQSRDADTEWEIRVNEDGQLVLRRAPASQFALHPVYENAWRVEGIGLIYAHRDRKERVIHLSVSAGRVYDMRFYRLSH